jgi:hypothetical protein
MIRVNGVKKTPAVLINDILKKHIKEAMEEVYAFENYVDNPEKLTDNEKEQIIKTMVHQLNKLKNKMGISITFMWDI